MRSQYLTQTDQINTSVIKEFKKKKPPDNNESIKLNAYPVYWVNYKNKYSNYGGVDSTIELSDLSLHFLRYGVFRPIFF